MAKLNEAQIKVAWEEWLAAEMRANYFGDLCASYTQRQRVATWATLVLSSGAVVVFLGKINQFPDWSAAALALLAALVSLYSLVAQNPKCAADCADLHSRWNKLGMEYQDLWSNWYSEDATERLTRLNERRAEASKSGTSFDYDEKRMLKWYESVVRHRAPAVA